MKEFVVCVPLEYVQGHLRYGHLEYTISAETEAEAIKIAKESDDYKLIIDDYEVNDYGDEEWDNAWAE